MYEAAHFYQVEVVLDLLRNKILDFCTSRSTIPFSQLTNTAWKYQDYKLIQFSLKYFSEKPHKIINDADFLKFTPASVNFWFQSDDLLVNEIDLLKALEKYVANNQSISIKALKPAIGSIRFLALSNETIEKTPLLTEIEKNSLLGQNTLNFFYLSKEKTARKR